ncbi:glucarate dehydratase [candidate division KSB1 bacterium]|nr:glucarate dehydratase [candidate division KSB1 bacterium]
MKIIDLKAQTAAIPIEAPTRHSYASPSHYIRTMIELCTDEGLTGVGETYSTIPPAAFDALKELLIGQDPFQLEQIRIQISQRGYFSRQPLLLTPVEMACYDLQGKFVGLPVYQLLGGRVREQVPVSAYLFYRYPNADGTGEISNPDHMTAYCQSLVDRYGFQTLKLKGGVLDPEIEVETIAALRKKFDSSYRLRFDPNAIWSPATAIRMGLKLAPYDLEYYEDPTWGISGLARVREKVPIPISTNMSVIEFEHLAPAVEMKAIDCILTDPWYWGGLYHTKVLDLVAKHMGLAVSMHSGVEFGVGLAAMLHVAVTMPNLVHAIDSHYHHLCDDVIAQPRFVYDQGCLHPSSAPGLGVTLDEDKMQRYTELHRQLAENDYGYPPDPRRPEWYARVPMW